MTRTEPREHPRWCTRCLADEHWQVWVVLLDGQVVVLDELAVTTSPVRRRSRVRNWQTHRVPADAGPVCEHSIRISRSAGENALANDMAARTAAVRTTSGAVRVRSRERGVNSSRQTRVNFPVDSVHRRQRRRRATPSRLRFILRTKSSDRVGEMDEKQRQDEYASSRADRLPSLQEVLSRRTRPPVDLFMF